MKMPEIMNLLTAYLFLKGLKLSHQIMILLILWVTKIIFKEALCSDIFKCEDPDQINEQ